MLDALDDLADVARAGLRGIALEKANADNPRNPAEFFLSKGPLSDPNIPSEGRLGVVTSDQNKGWSIKSLKKEWKAKAQPLSHLSDAIVPKKTAANGHHHRSRLRSQSSCSALPDRPAGYQEWPERTSSRKSWARPLIASLSSRTLSRIIDPDGRHPETHLSVGEEGNGPNSSARSATPERTTKTTSKFIWGHHSHKLIARRIRGSSNVDPKSIEAHDATQRESPASSKIGDAYYNPTALNETSQYQSTGPINNGRPESRQLDPSYLETSTIPERCLAHNFPKFSIPLLCGSSSSPTEHYLQSTAPTPCRDARRSATNNVTQQALAPPHDLLLPESPGFPKMLASMDFPSPPTRSRPSSPDRSIESSPCHQATSSARPTVRPRTSSKRACTSMGMRTASLDELIMEPTRQTLHNHELDGPLCTPNTLKVFISASFPNRSPVDVAAIMQDTPTTIHGHDRRSPSCTSSTLSEPSFDPAAGISSSDASSQMQLFANNVTATPSSRQNFTKNKLYHNNITAIRAPATIRNRISEDPKATTRYYSADLLLSMDTALVQPSENIGSAKDPTLGSDQAKLTSHPPFNIPTSLLWGRQASAGRKSIVERRIARQATVRAYKRRDLNTAKFSLKTPTMRPSTLDPTDSPILGWFAGNIPRPRMLSIREPSPAETGQRGLAHSGPATCGGTTALSSCDSSTSTLAQVTPGAAIKLIGFASTAPSPNSSWTISPIMALDITPHQPTHTTLSMSPIMVVTDIEPPPNQSTSLMSSPATTHPSSRPILRHRLKIIPQYQQKATQYVTHRTSLISEAERGISKNRINRHSLASTPTHAPSPEILSLRRRSLPVGASYPAQPHARWNPSPNAEHSVSHDINQGECEKSKWRITAIKERLRREKLAREEEISILVAETISSPKSSESIEEEATPVHEEHTTQQIEKRLRRLEENGDAWLRVVKTLLENMSKTLDELREDDKGCLTMSEFTVNMDAEAKRFSSSNQPLFTRLNTNTPRNDIL
ncbi:hypothetical protein AAE478_004831 [Parahypoxylon ruwenzoriense]